MSQILHDVAGVIPKEVVVMNDQEVIMESEEEPSIIGFIGNTWVISLRWTIN